MIGKICLMVCSIAAATESLDIVSRSDWGAAAPKHTTNLKTNPPNYVIIHHSDTASCTTKDTCIKRVKNIQSQHKGKGWSDIGYNFLVGEDGNVYEGRGWGKQGSHAPSYNSNSIGICFIGNYVSQTPNTAALQAAKDLIAQGVSNNKISSSYKLLGHRQTKATECPGTSLYNVIKTWSNWSSKP